MPDRLLHVLAACLVLMSGGCSRSQGISPHAVPSWTHYHLNASVYTLTVDGTVLWVGTEKGLITYDLLKDRVVEKFDDTTGLPSRVVTVVRKDPAGKIWVGTHGGGLVRFDGKKRQVFSPPDIADPYVYDVVFRDDGTVWVANWKGVSVYNGTQWRSYTKADGIADDWVYALAFDREGVLWLGTEGGVTQFDGHGWKSYTHHDGLGAGRAVIGESERLIIPGLHHQQREKEAGGYNPDYVLAVAVDRDDVKWFGTWGAGLSRFDGRTWKTYTTKDGLAGNFVSDIATDREGALWVATDGGVSRLDGTRWVTYTTQNGLLSNSVYTLVIDHEGHQWFGTEEGISKIETIPG